MRQADIRLSELARAGVLNFFVRRKLQVNAKQSRRETSVQQDRNVVQGQMG